MLSSHASQSCRSAALRIPQGCCNGSRAEQEGIARLVVCNVGRHCRAWSRRAASGVCQQTPSGLVTGCELSSGEKAAGPGELAFPHFGARLFAFSLGHGFGIDACALLTQRIGSPCCG